MKNNSLKSTLVKKEATISILERHYEIPAPEHVAAEFARRGNPVASSFYKDGVLAIHFPVAYECEESTSDYFGRLGSPENTVSFQVSKRALPGMKNDDDCVCEQVILENGVLCIDAIFERRGRERRVAAPVTASVCA